MTFRFDVATQVRAVGNGKFSARVHDGWDIGGNANGGYLLALVASALREATGRPLPVAVSCHYLGPVNDAETLDRVWNGERIQEIREAVSRGNGILRRFEQTFRGRELP